MKNNTQFHVNGIVIKEQSHGEQGKLLTVITEYNGVITVNAKNARKISAGYLKSTQVFAYSNMLLYNKNGYYTLLEAELNNDFYSLREDIETFAFASYACETVAAVTTEGEDGKTLLSFLLNTLFICGKNVLPVSQQKAIFEFRLAVLCGFLPELEYCQFCGEPLESIKNKSFDLSEGAICCTACTVEEGENPLSWKPISDGCYKALHHIAFAQGAKLYAFRTDENTLRELGEITEKYLIPRLEKKIKSLEFFHSLEGKV